MPISNLYIKAFHAGPAVIDANGHVNNVAYVQWMQDIAIEHYHSLGGNAAQGDSATWVVRKHDIEYFAGAIAGDEIEGRTWIEDLRRVRSLRKYEFVRKADGIVLVRAQTDWVFVDTTTGAPRAVSAAVITAITQGAASTS
ncbi:MAG: acyl-CoA thioesterase [Gammaproteobacteria bacterium]|nr:acyl-CoA thioesterase [Gammaproteobacteria bacterium]